MGFICLRLSVTRKPKEGIRGNLAKANLVLLWSPTHHFFILYSRCGDTRYFMGLSPEGPDTPF